jgi:quinol-cytochrome oxidoreductase complex cytochrome b subunit
VVFFNNFLISLSDTPMEQATASRNKKITTSYLQSSLRLMTKFFLMIFVIGIIVITILGGAAALSSDKTTTTTTTTTSYAHFFGERPSQ